MHFIQIRQLRLNAALLQRQNGVKSTVLHVLKHQLNR